MDRRSLTIWSACARKDRTKGLSTKRVVVISSLLSVVFASLSLGKSHQ
jgi:hypothetical protein